MIKTLLVLGMFSAGCTSSSSTTATSVEDLNGCRPGTPKCQPEVCVGANCSHNRGADGVCRANCGGTGFCPDLNSADVVHCDALCSSVTGTVTEYVACKANCVNAVRYDCTAGQEPAPPWQDSDAPDVCGRLTCATNGECGALCRCVVGICRPCGGLTCMTSGDCGAACACFDGTCRAAHTQFE